MNTYITLACLFAVAAVSHGSAIGYGYGLGSPLLAEKVISYPILSPAAVSTANLVKAAPIPVIRTVAAPVIVKSVPIGPIGYGPISPLGYGLGWNGLGLKGLSGLSGLGVKDLGYGWH